MFFFGFVKQTMSGPSGHTLKFFSRGQFSLRGFSGVQEPVCFQRLPAIQITIRICIQLVKCPPMWKPKCQTKSKKLNIFVTILLPGAPLPGSAGLQGRRVRPLLPPPLLPGPPRRAAAPEAVPPPDGAPGVSLPPPEQHIW